MFLPPALRPSAPLRPTVGRGRWTEALAMTLALALAGVPSVAAAQDEEAAPAPDEAADTGAVLPIVSYPSILEYVQADYPPEAKAAGLEAEVGLFVELDETGAVTYVEVSEPAGHGFDEAAVDAVKRMRFTPARTEAGPVAVGLPFAYAFELPDAPEPEAPPADDGDTGDTAEAPPPPAEAPSDTGGDDTGDTGEPDPNAIVAGPQILDYVDAPYPPEAEAAGIEGTVVLLVTLDETGAVEDVAVSQPAGNGFDEAALEAVRQMTFTPARTSEGPIGVVFEFAYAFTLEPETEPTPFADIVTIEGVVRQMGTRAYVEGATVFVPGIEASTLTDADGHFELKGVPPGDHVLKVRHPEHVELDQPVSVVEGEVTEAKLWIRGLTYRENEAVGYYEKDRTEVTRRTLSIEEVKRIPGSFGDPVKVIQTLPGAARAPFGTGFLIIRGADPEDTSVYVDGIEVPIIYHLTGITSILSPEIVEAVDYLPGGYGVEFGRSMGGTVNVRTKQTFDRMKISGGFDILDAQAWFEGPVDKKKNHAIALGARRSYIDAFIPLLTGGSGFNIQPIYWDYQFKYIPKLPGEQNLNVFVFGFRDTIDVSTPDDVAQGSSQQTQGNISTAYMTHTVALRYTKQFSETVRFMFQPSLALTTVDAGLGNSFRIATSSLATHIRAEAGWQMHPAIEMVGGVDFRGGPFNFDFQSGLSFADLDDPLAEPDPIGFDGQTTRWFTAPWLEFNVRPLKDRSRWLLQPAIRYDSTVITTGGGITLLDGPDGASEPDDIEPTYIHSLDPRLGTRFIAYEKGDMLVTLKGSTGLYHQPPQVFQSFALGGNSTIRSERSWNSSVGIEHRVNQAISWDLEGFYRSMSDLIGFNNGLGASSSEPFVNGGEGYAAGFEVQIRHAPVNRFFGWISYTFSRSFRRNSPDAEWVPFNYDQPHIFSAQGGYNFPFDIGLSAQLQVVSGNPFTPNNAGIYDADTNSYNGFSVGSRNSERLPTFVQTSIRLDKTFTFKTWQLEAYVEVINALRGVNAEGTVYNYDFSEYAFIRGLPTIPNIGLEFRYYP